MGDQTRAQQKLKAYRLDRGLTMEEAGALIVVDGKPVDRPTWFGWESKGKIPRPAWMVELDRLGIAEPNDFYHRLDGGGQPEPPAQAALAIGGL